MMRMPALFVLLVALGAAAPVRADYLRCNGNVVAVGDIKLQVLKRCGEPALKETREKERAFKSFDRGSGRSREFYTSVQVDEWTYNFGPGQLLSVVTFEDGRVVNIETNGFGF